jgi:hypothetical protein
MIILGCPIINDIQNQMVAPTSFLIMHPRTFTERDEHGLNDMPREKELPSCGGQYNVISAGAILPGAAATDGLATCKVRYRL